MGSDPSLCRLYGVETIACQYRATWFVMSSLFGIWAETLLEGRLSLLVEISPQQVAAKIEGIIE